MFINVFFPGIMASSRIVCELSSYLVRGKVYPLYRKVGSKNFRKTVVSFGITNTNYEYKLTIS